MQIKKQFKLGMIVIFKHFDNTILTGTIELVGNKALGVVVKGQWIGINKSMVIAVK